MLYAAVLAVVALGLDAATTAVIQLSILYAVPVVIAGWAGYGRLAVLLGVFQSLGRLVLEVAIWHSDTLRWTGTINALVRIAILTVMAVLSYRGGKHSRQLSAVFDALSKLVPICSHCRRMRDQRGEWHTVDAFLSPPLQFTLAAGLAAPASQSTLCPDCERQVYGEFDRRAVRRWVATVLISVAALIAALVWLFR